MSIVKDAILVELGERASKSQEYDHLCSQAKTTTKRNFYKKKLVANNNIIADLIVALEKINRKENNNNNNGDTNGTLPDAEGNSEEPSVSA